MGLQLTNTGNPTLMHGYDIAREAFDVKYYFFYQIM